jgi:phosphatidylethanolamine-binding protein (PEBP) family uncharacterized protein
VAQRTGDQRLLETVARTASAGWVPALAVSIALVLGGCGGGSSDPPSTSVESSPSAAAGAPSASPDAGGGTGPATGAGASSGEGGSSEAQGGAEGQSRGEKHGPRVSQPTGPREPGITAKERREATIANMSLRSPGIAPEGGPIAALPARYTCDGANTWPALTWSGVPPDTAELVLYAMNVQPVDGKLFVDWAVAGLDPNLGEIQSGKLPRGAVVGRNSFGQTSYSVCPTGSSELYMFALYALPKSLSPTLGFEPHEFRKAVLQVSGNAGLLPLSYARG